MENRCNGRCEECSINQRTYCAAQMAYYAQQEIAAVKGMLSALGEHGGSDAIILMRDEEQAEESEIEENEA